MKRFARHALTALAAATLSVLAAGCQPADKAESETANAEAPAEGEATDGVVDVAGLETGKEQASYMIGRDMARSLEDVKDKIDMEVLVDALQAGIAGEESRMTEAQLAQVREAFAREIQAARIAEMMAAAKENKAEGEAFLAANAEKPDVQVTESGLQYQVLREAEGPTPTGDATVRVHYEGSLLDGETFDSSYERQEPVQFALDQVVPGWQEGIALMPVGSKYRFWIPSELGYGEAGTPGGPIGPNEVLVFEVELLDIVDQQAQQAQ